MKLFHPANALLLAVLLSVSACGSEKKPQNQQPDPTADQQVNIPFAKDESDRLAAVEVPEEKLPDLSGLSKIEAEIFRRSIALQIPYYDVQYKWAEKANTITEGTEAAAAMKDYLNIQNEFARAMQRLDLEFVGKLDPNYQGSKAFEKAIDRYLENPELLKRIEFIMNSFRSLMERFKDDPACRSVLAEIERIANQPQ